jgi:hypothetical protein
VEIRIAWRSCNGIARAALLAAALFCVRPDAQGAEDPGTWSTFVQAFIGEYFRLHPSRAVGEGLHEFDGQLPDWSRAALAQETAWLHEQRTRAEAFDAQTLPEAARFEREYFLAVIDDELFWLETAGWPYKNPEYYSGALDPHVYVTREYAPLETRLRAYVSYAEKVPAALAQIRSNLKTPLPKTYADLGRIVFGGYASFYEQDVPAVFASVNDPVLQARFKAVNAAATAAMQDMDAWFEAQQKTASGDFALGPGLFREMLWATERVAVPLSDLKAIAERDLERNLAALREACADYAPGKTVQQCMEQEQADKPDVGPLEAATEQLTRLKAFVVEKELVSIPGPEQAQVRETPPYQRYNSASIDIPGPYEENLPSFYYIAPPDPSWSEEDQAAYMLGRGTLLATSVHEVWPGHFLQFLHANRARSKFGQIFVGYAFAEGWAHYSEEMMIEAGLGDDDPGARVGQLHDALLRNVRFLSAIGLHTEGMTVAESERLFRDKAFQDPGNARQQAARGTFDPAYLNYTMGKLMIRKLRADWTATRGGRAAWREFHDRFLSYGGPPIPLLRKAMLGDTDTGTLF